MILCIYTNPETLYKYLDFFVTSDKLYSVTALGGIDRYYRSEFIDGYRGIEI